jgi:dipeptidyl aminopeptidase/acylaminoacyl peptidase
LRNVLAVAVAAAMVGGAAASPALHTSDTGRVAFVLRDRGVDGIYTINADGSGLRLLSRLPKGLQRGGDMKPAWSPDGRRLAFARDIPLRGKDRLHVYIMQSDGSKAQRLTSGPPLQLPNPPAKVRRTFDTMPTWSPDGDWIGFVRATAPGAALSYLFRVRGGGGATGRLTRGYTFDWAPAWMPDGTQVAFAHEFPGRALRRLSHKYPQLVFLRVGTQQYVGSPNVYGGDFSWSRDGKRLALVSFVDGNGKTCVAGGLNRYVLGLAPSAGPRTQCLPAGEIYTVNGNGVTGLTRLTNSPADDRHPSFSPDGTQIVFSSGYPSGGGHPPWLYVMPASGGEQKLLFAPRRGAALDPAWSPASAQ